MKHLAFISAILISVSGYTQNWQLLNKNYRYNYYRNNSKLIHSTVFAEAAFDMGNDSLFYMNTIVKDCDTCTKVIEDPVVAYYDQPQFLQKRVVKYRNFYTFKIPQKIVINYKAGVNDSWVFDTINNIAAKIVSLSETDLFGKTDSVKVIELSNNDTIIQSKSFGIVRFDSGYDSSQYILAGIDNIIGETVPRFNDFFNFSVGDIFEYHGSSWAVESADRSFIEKVEITSKKQMGDTLEYGASVIYFEKIRRYYDNPGSSSSKRYSTTLRFINTPEHPVNGYNNQLVKILDYINKNFCHQQYEYSRVRYQLDSKGAFIKTVGLIPFKDFYSICNSQNKMLCRPHGLLCDEHEVSYKVGLGKVHQRLDGFEWHSKRDLVAYRINNDTIGNLTPDEKLLVHAATIEKTKTEIYPNPADKVLFIQNMHPNIKIQSVHLINTAGQIIDVQNSFVKDNLIQLNIADFKPGLYLVKICYPEETEVVKILKK